MGEEEEEKRMRLLLRVFCEEAGKDALFKGEAGEIQLEVLELLRIILFLRAAGGGGWDAEGEEEIIGIGVYLGSALSSE